MGENTDPGDSASGPAGEGQLEQALRAELHDGERYVAFGELTVAGAAAQAERMGELKGWGPLDRVRPIADAWRTLVRELEDAGAERVADLEAATVIEYASKLWITKPPGGLIK